MSHKTRMHGHGELHSGIVPTKRSNAGQGGPQEIAEGRPWTEENAVEPNPCWKQGQESGPSGLDRVRQAAKRDKQLRFTALLHHVNIDLLRGSYYDLKRRAAAGVDGVTWQAYGDGLEERLADLHGRIHRGAYRAKPSRRAWIDKDDGRKRPLGIAALEDKIVQSAVMQVLNPIWEEDFLDFSYGFRPGRKPPGSPLGGVGRALRRDNQQEGELCAGLGHTVILRQSWACSHGKVRTASDWR